jgi:poly(A) polymerase
VRDLLLGHLPPDYDVATSARPDDVVKLFRRTIPVGVQFGVVRVRLMGGEFEVATFRADEGYTDGRHPDGVRFTDLAEDVRRRDFTINGLALDPHTGDVVDLVGGRADLDAGLIRAIGDPDARFTEDRLRPLRAVRFAARTGFTIEKATMDAIRRHAGAVIGVSVERIQEEMRKTLTGPRPGTGYRLLEDSGLGRVLFPELDDASQPEIAAACLDRLAGRDVATMWAAVLWPLDEAGAGRVLDRLRHSRKTTRDALDTLAIARKLPNLPGDTAMVKRLLRRERAGEAIELLASRMEAEGRDPSAASAARVLLAGWSRDDLFPERLADGNDAISAGIPRGPEVATALAALEDARLRGNVLSREDARIFLEGRAGLLTPRGEPDSGASTTGAIGPKAK